MEVISSNVNKPSVAPNLDTTPEELIDAAIKAFAMFLSNDLGSLWSTKNTLAGLGGGLGLPLFTGGRRIANLKLKKDEYERLLNNYYKTNLTAIQEVNDALVSIRLDHEKYQDVEKQAKLERLGEQIPP